jgi:hypothetical protein
MLWFIGKTWEVQRDQIPIGNFTVAVFGTKEETQTVPKERQ